jgi:hypothetical protein
LEASESRPIAGHATGETFAALDSDASVRPLWIHAGARSAEAGFEDPALGWVGVRAGADAHGVHASVVPGSAEAAAALGGHMSGLNAFLSEHHAELGKVTLAGAENQSGGTSTNGGTGHDASAQNGEPGNRGAGGNLIAESDRVSTTAEQSGRIAAQPASETAANGRSGVHISVMA